MYRRPAVTPLLLFFAAAAYLVSFSAYGINLWDEGGIYQGALRYLDGQRVGVDFYGYAPGRYYLVEAVFRLLGNEMLPVRQMLAAATGLFAVFTFNICRRLMPPLYTAAAVLLVVSAPAVYYQRFYGLAFLFSMWSFAIYVENRRNFPWLFAAAAYCYVFKIEVLLVTGPVYLFFLWEVMGAKAKKWGSAVAVALIALLAIEKNLVEIVYYELPAAVSRWSNPFPIPWEGYQGKEFGLFSLGENFLFYLPFLAAIALLVLAAISGGQKERRLLALLGYMQFAAMSIVVTRAGFDNLIRCLPLFFIAACYLCYKALEAARRSKPARLAAVSLFAALFIFYMVDFNYQNGFYAGSIGAVRDADAKLEGGLVSGIRVNHTDAAIISDVTKWINTASKPDDPIFALPLNPIWYYLSGRKNHTYYDWVLPASFSRGKNEAELVEQLKKNPPALIILVDLEIDNLPKRRLKNYAPLVAAWVVDNYRYNGRVAYFQMWKRNVAE